MKRVVRIGFASLGIALVLGFGAANVADYVRFQQAWTFGDDFTDTDYQRLAGAIAAAERRGHWRADRPELPPEIQRFGILSASFFPGSSDLLLYELGDVYLYVRFRSSATNQEILTFTNAFGPQHSKHLWTRDAELRRQLNPSNRTLTVSEWTIGSLREWIIRPGEIMIVDRGQTVASDDVLVATYDLSASQHRAIESAATAIPPTLRGRYVTSGAMDGISLRVCYSRDGAPDAQDFALANTWVEAADPLIESLAQWLPLDHTPRFKRLVAGEEHAHRSYQKSYTWAEREALDPVARVPWWCWWRWWTYGQRLTSPENLEIDAWTFWVEERERQMKRS